MTAPTAIAAAARMLLAVAIVLGLLGAVEAPHAAAWHYYDDVSIFGAVNDLADAGPAGDVLAVPSSPSGLYTHYDRDNLVGFSARPFGCRFAPQTDPECAHYVWIHKAPRSGMGAVWLRRGFQQADFPGVPTTRTGTVMRTSRWTAGLPRNSRSRGLIGMGSSPFGYLARTTRCSGSRSRTRTSAAEVEARSSVSRRRQ